MIAWNDTKISIVVQTSGIRVHPTENAEYRTFSRKKIREILHTNCGLSLAASTIPRVLKDKD